MTYAVQGALQKAVAYSKEYELQNIEIEALLKATMNENDSLFKSILERANIDVNQLEQAYDNQLSHYPTVQGDNVQYGQYISSKTNELLDKAEKYMKSYEDEFISMEQVHGLVYVHHGRPHNVLLDHVKLILYPQHQVH